MWTGVGVRMGMCDRYRVMHGVRTDMCMHVYTDTYIGRWCQPLSTLVAEFCANVHAKRRAEGEASGLESELEQTYLPDFMYSPLAVD